jgi:hypothetical protein
MTLDERIRRDCERSAVPFHVEDDALLDWVADLLIACHEEGGADAVA